MTTHRDQPIMDIIKFFYKNICIISYNHTKKCKIEDAIEYE